MILPIQIKAIFLLFLLFLSFYSTAAYLKSGDLRLRYDLQMLADYGVISTPLTTWPLSWRDIQRALGEYESEPTFEPLLSSYQRVKDEAEHQARTDSIAVKGMATIATQEHSLLSRYSNYTRDEASLALRGDWQGESGFISLNASISHNNASTELLFNQSAAALALGNWLIALDRVDRWWGPGYEGSLILSNNARPIPKIVLQRQDSTPFESPWLSWLGPWHLITFVGQLEEDRYVPKAKIFGLRLTMKPLPTLEIGLSRAAQFGGRGRPEDLSTFFNMLAGFDNGPTDGHTSKEEEPGNQLAGYDLRWGPIFGAPLALYLQIIGEDESNALPTAKMHLLGIEGWGGDHSGSFRWHLEYSDTATIRGLSLNPEYRFNTSYNHHLYQSGYHYDDQAIGHSVGGDSRLYSLGVSWIESNGTIWDILMNKGNLNRDGSGVNPLSPDHQELRSVGIGYNRILTSRMGLECHLGWQKVINLNILQKNEDITSFCVVNVGL